MFSLVRIPPTSCCAVLANFGFRLGWEPSLFTNSLAILMCYRCAAVDSFGIMVRKSGVRPTTYAIGDAIVHGLPVAVLAVALLRKRRYLRPQHGAFSLLAQVHFAYSQGGQLDMGALYVPHDAPVAWAASIAGHMIGPALLNRVMRGEKAAAAAAGLAVSAPLLLKLGGWRRWADGAGPNWPEFLSRSRRWRKWSVRARRKPAETLVDVKEEQKVLCDRCQQEI